MSAGSGWRLLSAPLAAMAVVAVVGWWGNRTLESSMRRVVREELRTLLNADVTAMEIWIERHRTAVTTSANRPELRRLVGELLRERRLALGEPARELPAARELRSRMDSIARDLGYLGWAVVSPDLTVAAAGRPALIGTSVAGGREWLDKVLQGGTVLTPPVPSDAVAAPADGTVAPVTMFAAAPVRGEADRVVAILGFRVSLDEFTRILTVARMGESGETYAFDVDGVMVSRSRFDDQLRSIGLLPGDPSSTSLLNIEIRNPGGDMTTGFVPSAAVRARPLTRMAADAVAGNAGVDVAGYRDYRGVPVVGAWTWLPELGLGVTTEVDVAEAYATLFVLRRGFWTLLGLLALGSVGILIYALLIARLQRKVEKAELLGQYRLVRKIGEGGMGKVYLAEHSMLRRPTAVKMIRTDEADGQQVKRFEREVQFTSQLTHPNTIRVFDFGRTPEGVFYYAMEYLEGITLNRVVAASGPLPEGRVIYILEQICGSLAEAHLAGLIHRDIKPANVILCERGGLYDFVKVLDFGLVRRVDQSGTAALTKTQMITGTPLYLPPEGITAPDKVGARSDLYSVGGVGYFLLTGEPVFRGDAFEVCGQHIHATPEPPSARLGRQVSSDLEEILLRCLEKDPEDRLPDAQALRSALRACDRAGEWTEEHARKWWEETLDWSQVKGESEAAPATPRSTDQSAFRVDLGTRAGAGRRS